MEFKGTKGKWIYNKELEEIQDEEGYSIFPCGNVNFQYLEANHILVQKAPELLEDKIENLSYMEELAMLIPADCWTEEFIDRFNLKMHKTQKLIKDATEL